MLSCIRSLLFPVRCCFRFRFASRGGPSDSVFDGGFGRRGLFFFGLLVRVFRYTYEDRMRPVVDLAADVLVPVAAVRSCFN